MLFNVHEELPGVLGDAVGEVLYVVAAGCGVDNLVHVALFLEQQLLVAADAVAETVGLLVGDVEGVGGDAVGTGYGGRHGLGGGAEHVHVGVEDRLVPEGADGIDEHLAAAVALGFVLLHNLAPQHAGGTNLGNLHEVVAACGEVEHEVLGHLVHGEAAVGEVCHHVVGGGEGEGKFLHDAGAGVVDIAAVDSQHAEAGKVLFGKVDELDGLVVCLFLTVAVASVEQGAAVDVEVAAALCLGGVVAVGSHSLDKELEGFKHVLAAGEINLASLGVDAFQQGLHLLRAANLAGAQSYGVGAAFQSLQGQGVGLLQSLGFYVLADVPYIVVGVFASGVGSLGGIAVEILKVVKVFGTVVGLHLETFDGLPYQFLFVIGTFEVLINHFFPFFGGDRREFAEQFVVFHYIMPFYYQQLSKQSYNYFST